MDILEAGRFLYQFVWRLRVANHPAIFSRTFDSCLNATA